MTTRESHTRYSSDGKSGRTTRSDTQYDDVLGCAIGRRTRNVSFFSSVHMRHVPVPNRIELTLFFLKKSKHTLHAMSVTTILLAFRPLYTYKTKNSEARACRRFPEFARFCTIGNIVFQLTKHRSSPFVHAIRIAAYDRENVARTRHGKNLYVIAVLDNNTVR